MPLSTTEASATAFLAGLNALSNILDKARAHAEAKKIEPNVLLATRLFPDMFSLTKQVQLACDFAKNACGRLAGGDFPKFEDTEVTFADLKARIDKTIAFIKSVKPAQLEGSEARDVTFPAGPNATRTMKGSAYLTTYALPNFYFHTTTAYAILRHCGVEIGKRDFLGLS